MAKKKIRQKWDEANDPDDLLSLLIARTIWPHLADQDESQSLRKALQLLIFIIQEYTKPGAAELITGLLTNFPPLSDHFVEHWPELHEKAKMTRVRDQSGKAALMVTEEFFKAAIRHEQDE